jgi:hypothetical protein
VAALTAQAGLNIVQPDVMAMHPLDFAPPNLRFCLAHAMRSGSVVRTAHPSVAWFYCRVLPWLSSRAARPASLPGPRG